jgi:hypothetical protein
MKIKRIGISTKKEMEDREKPKISESLPPKLDSSNSKPQPLTNK